MPHHVPKLNLGELERLFNKPLFIVVKPALYAK